MELPTLEKAPKSDDLKVGDVIWLHAKEELCAVILGSSKNGFAEASLLNIETSCLDSFQYMEKKHCYVDTKKAIFSIKVKMSKWQISCSTSVYLK